MSITNFEEFRDGRHFAHEESGVYLRAFEMHGIDQPTHEVEIDFVDYDGIDYRPTEERQEIVAQLLDAALAYYDETLPGVEIRSVVDNFFENWQVPLLTARGFAKISGKYQGRASSLFIRGMED